VREEEAGAVPRERRPEWSRAKALSRADIGVVPPGDLAGG